jgi:hypothetical protein
MRWVHPEILAIRRAREERLKRFPGVDIDAIHYARGAVSDGLKRRAMLRKKYPGLQ